jgi:mutator protein MutT
MKNSRNPATTAVYLVLRNQGEVLLARRFNTGYQDGNYAVPAGHIDAGELPTEALVREVAEEIGIAIESTKARFVHTLFRPKHDETGDRVDYFFEISEWSGEVKNLEPHKCDDLRWSRMDDLPSNMTPHVEHALRAIERGETFSELGEAFLRANGYAE